jgi:hypothetical protein
MFFLKLLLGFAFATPNVAQAIEWRAYQAALKSRKLDFEIQFPLTSGVELLYTKYLVSNQNFAQKSVCPLRIVLTGAEYSYAKTATPTRSKGSLKFLVQWDLPQLAPCLESIQAFAAPLLKQEQKDQIELLLLNKPDQTP